MTRLPNLVSMAEQVSQARDRLAPRPERLVTAVEVARHFRVSRSAVYRWAKEGLIEVVRTPGGGRLLFPAHELRAEAL